MDNVINKMHGNLALLTMIVSVYALMYVVYWGLSALFYGLEWLGSKPRAAESAEMTPEDRARAGFINKFLATTRATATPTKLGWQASLAENMGHLFRDTPDSVAVNSFKLKGKQAVFLHLLLRALESRSVRAVEVQPPRNEVVVLGPSVFEAAGRKLLCIIRGVPTQVEVDVDVALRRDMHYDLEPHFEDCTATVSFDPPVAVCTMKAIMATPGGE